MAQQSFYLLNDVPVDIPIFHGDIAIAQQLATLRHEHLFTPLRAFTCQNGHGPEVRAVMPRTQWKQLDRLWDYMSAEDACRIITGAASGAAYLHENGFVHHDISISTILVDERDLHARIACFESVRRSEEESEYRQDVLALGRVYAHIVAKGSSEYLQRVLPASHVALLSNALAGEYKDARELLEALKHLT